MDTEKQINTARITPEEIAGMKEYCDKATPGEWTDAATEGNMIYAGQMRICDIRGWGHLTGKGGGLGWSEDKAIAQQNANSGFIARSHTDLPRVLLALEEAYAENKVLRDALIEISKGEGAYSRDALTHASNCIEAMKAHAREAIEAVRGMEKANK